MTDTPIAATEGGLPWRPISEAPKDGSIIYSAVPIKWKPYKPTSEQYRRGIKGRWMESNGYGGWNPMAVQPEMFLATRTPSPCSLGEDVRMAMFLEILAANEAADALLARPAQEEGVGEAPSFDVMALEHLRELNEKATPFRPDDLMAYEHGGGRLAILRDGQRQLIADFYGDGPDRDFFMAAALFVRAKLASRSDASPPVQEGEGQ